MLAFFGITGISLVRTKGVALGADTRKQAMGAAQGEITRLAAW
ncbi:hypothetical protein VQH23_05435 [Pararoseomonas sp. SCSIO 73927]